MQSPCGLSQAVDIQPSPADWAVGQMLTDTEGVVPKQGSAKGFKNLILDVDAASAITIPLLHFPFLSVYKNRRD
jgi:hypothetical protein